MSRPSRSVAQVPRLALSVEEACASLGVSWDFWREHIAGGVRIVRAGRRKLVPVRELERWVSEHAERALEGPRSDGAAGKVAPPLPRRACREGCPRSARARTGSCAGGDGHPCTGRSRYRFMGDNR